MCFCCMTYEMINFVHVFLSSHQFVTELQSTLPFQHNHLHHFLHPILLHSSPYTCLLCFLIFVCVLLFFFFISRFSDSLQNSKSLSFFFSYFWQFLFGISLWPVSMRKLSRKRPPTHFFLISSLSLFLTHVCQSCPFLLPPISPLPRYFINHFFFILHSLIKCSFILLFPLQYFYFQTTFFLPRSVTFSYFSYFFPLLLTSSFQDFYLENLQFYTKKKKMTNAHIFVSIRLQKQKR